MKKVLTTMTLWTAACAPCFAQNADEVAKQLSNPIASLTSVPFQFNHEQGAGVTGDGERLRLNIQPVIPFSIGEDWNLLSRTIVPVIEQHGIIPGAGDQSGIGNVMQSLFFSPKAVTGSGWTWGIRSRTTDDSIPCFAGNAVRHCVVQACRHTWIQTRRQPTTLRYKRNV